MNTPITRRAFLAKAAFSGAGFMLLPNARSAKAYQANEKLNVALVGVGGRGRWFVRTIPQMENVVALCDVNEQKAGESFQQIPKAKKFHDFRRMLDKMDREIDAVIIAVPDHTHAVASMTAMQHGKHVYCEKPLTQNLYEARTVRETAAQSNGVTQMGNQGTASEAFRRTIEWVRSGALGEIREVHAWNTGGGAGDRPLPDGSKPVPDHLEWDLWLGPAAARPYHPDWMSWHTWRDFATGQLGNWASHTLNAAFKSLRLDALWQDDFESPRVRIEADVSGIHKETFPRSESIRYEFPSREGLPPVTVHWHNGAGHAPNRELLEDLAQRKLDWGDAGEKKWRDHAGCILVGSKGKVHLNGHNTTFTLLPADKFQKTDRPPQSLPRSPGHEKEWLQACKGGPQPMSHFGYGGPLTEFVLLGNIATQFEGPVEFDAAAFRITNREDANDALKREYRDGWSLGG